MFFIEKKIINDAIWGSSGVVSKLEDGIAMIIGLNNILVGERIIVGENNIEALLLNIENKKKNRGVLILFCFY